MKIIHLLALIILLPFSIFSQEEKNYDEAYNLINVWLDAQMDYDKIPGLSVAVIDDQEIQWSGAFGTSNRESNAKFDISTLCSICSISKLFTSVAIMKLYEEGKLRLDDEIDDILPWYNLKQQYETSGPITIRSLLTHSSGLPRESNQPYWSGPDFPFPNGEEVKNGLKDQSTLYPSSTYFQYSNLGMTLLGEVVAEVSGQSYEEYVQQNILDQLRLENTRPEMPKDLYGDDLAIGYSSLKRDGNRDKVKFFNADGIAPAAGFTSNVTDLGAFASWQFRLLDTSLTEILKPSTLKYMQQVHFTDPNWKTTWGLGFVVYKGPDGKKWVGHGGSCPGYRSVLQIIPDTKKAYAVMINSSGTNPGKYAKGVRQILEKVKPIKKDSSIINEIDMTANVDLNDFVGYYNSQPWWGERYVAKWNDQLVTIGMPSDDPGEDMTFYKHLEGDIFRKIRDDEELGEELIFSRDAYGKVNRLSSHGNFSERINSKN